MSEKLSISQWAEEDKPREKLERLGASALSNAELLAILIGSGSRDESAVDLMKRIMSNCDNNLNTLGKKTIRELTEYKGMGPAKAITIMAACELGKIICPTGKIFFPNWEIIFSQLTIAYLCIFMHRYFCCLFLFL